ncbi:TPA: threonine--tRNA ligase [Candidatus Gracilibacteria bacterium]|nr:threonine--tRNA ligase [Candidatus Gracilibacteria bacterium]
MSYPITTTRHSLAHIMAQAVKSLYPDVKLAIGPDIENGFYYDFDFGEVKFEEAALKDIEKKMKNIIKQNQKFEYSTMPVDEAIKFLESKGEPYKVEMARDLKTSGETEIGFYRNITQQGAEAFVDMCRGPHVEKTIEIDENTFKLDKIAGAYWKGDSKNQMVTRIYAFAFETREELDAHLKMLEEAKKRDHRILGKKLKLFTISELVGAGLPLMQPKGMIIRKAIEDYLWELHGNKGYDRVWTPHLAKEALYECSGHAGHYMDDMFSVKGGSSGEGFYLKPMNCPHHMQLFADNQFSYRDMPIRYFEPATVYRDEKSGQLSGLTRVRAITQDDGHLFCRVDQIKDEVSMIVEIIKTFYTTFGLMEGYWVSLSVRDPQNPDKYLGGDNVWKIAEGALEEAAKDNKLNYKRIEGEAAFYGPKLDFMFKDAIGREWQLATIQCDFNLPERFDLSFINEKNEKERPVVIHRAIAGSLERFMGIMIEHFAGTFPLWLAPVQTVVVPVSENFLPYAQEVQTALKKAGIRSELDASNDGLNKKVRNAELSHTNYILVVGEKEMTERSVAVRNYKTKEQSEVKLDAFIRHIGEEIENKSL